MKNCPYCNSDLKINKQGKKYCSNICWTKEPWKSQRILEQLEYEAIMESQHSDWGDR
jgi:hypothetical protein